MKDELRLIAARLVGVGADLQSFISTHPGSERLLPAYWRLLRVEGDLGEALSHLGAGRDLEAAA